MAEPENIIGPGPSPNARLASPDAFRKSHERRLPRNINFMLGGAAIVVAPALFWYAFGDAFMSLARQEKKVEDASDLRHSPPTGEFKLNFPPEPKIEQEPPPQQVVPPPPEPVTPASLAQEEAKPEIEMMHDDPPEPPYGPTDGEPKNPYGPVSGKIAMIGQIDDDKFGVDATTRDKWQGCAVEPGYVVPVNLVHHVNSEIPGPAIFETREPYYSPSNPYEPLFHVGVRFIGYYRTEKGGGGDKLGDTRVSFKIETATIPEGKKVRRLNLKDARIAVLSGNGMVGLGGEVDQNLLPLLGYATIHAFIDSASRTATDEESMGGRVRGSVAENYGEVGSEVADRTLDVAPKIKIAPGPALLLFSDPVRVGKCR